MKKFLPFVKTLASTVILMLVLFTAANAQVSVTQATSGTNISADNAANATASAPAYTTLGNIVIAEGTATDFDPTVTSITLTAPTGWQFLTSSGVSAVGSGGDVTVGTIDNTSTSQIVINLSVAGGGSTDVLTISGVQVISSDGSVIPNSGNITVAIGGGPINNLANGDNLGSLSQVAGALNKFVFSSISSPQTAGSSFTVATVSAEDQFGTVLSNANTNGNAFTGTVTFSTNAAGGSVSPTTSSAFADGVLSAQSLTVTKAVSQAITATLGAVTGLSNSFGVDPGAASQLIFTAQPGSAASGGTISAVTVTAEDANGNVVTGYTGNVTISIGTNPSSGTLGGTLTVAAVNGVATFSDLSIDKAGTGYTLSATDGTMSTAPSGSFDITAGAATHVVFSAQPSSAVSGIAISPAITVTALDASNNVVTGYTGSITISIANNAGGGTLNGTLSVAAVNGVATFNNLSIDKAGTGYTLSATDGTLSTGSSSAFNITAGAATHLVFTVQPTSATAGATINAVSVTAEDASNNIVSSYTGSVAISISNNPASGTLSGTLSVSAVNGVATFSDLSIDNPGTGYTLTATDGTISASPSQSASFDIVAGPSVSAGSLADFGTQCVNGTYGPNSFTITGTNLNSGNIVVNGLSGFTFSTTLVGTYTSSLTLSQAGGAYSQTIYVQFSPTAAVSYNGNIVIDGTAAGASTVNVAATGTGSPLPTLGSVSQLAAVCDGNNATINLTGLLASTQQTISYNINGGSTQTASVTSDVSGNGSFTVALVIANNNQTLSVTNIAIVGGTACSNSFSTGNSATLSVNASTAISTQPTAPAAVCAGGTAPTLSVTASGAGTLTYQWFNNGTTNSNTGGTSVGSANGGQTANYTPDVSAAGTTYYYVVVTGDCGVVTSNAVAVVVNVNTSITTQPTAPAAVCAGGTAPTLSVAASGTSLTYQWFNNGTTNSNTGGTSVGSANGGQTVNYTPDVSTAGTTYYYVVITGTCGVVTSNAVAVVVNVNTAITTQPTAPAAVCAGGTAPTLSVAANGTALTYQWFNNGTTNSNTGGTSVGSANGGQTVNYTPDVSTAGTTYYYVVITGTCGVVTSNAVAVVVNVNTSITTQPTAPAAVCAGGTAPTLSVAANGTALTYQWFNNGTTNSNTGGTSVGSANGGQTVNYTPSVSTAGTIYYYVVITGTCGIVTSNAVAVVVNALPTISGVSGTTTICSGTTTTLTASSAASSPTFNWYTAASGGSSIFTGAAFTTPTLSSNTTYYVAVTDETTGCASSSRTATAITVNALPTISGVSGTTTICSGNTTTLTASSAAPSPTFNWYTASSGGSPIFTGAAFTTPVLSATTTYYVDVTDGTTSCLSAARTAVTVTVNPLPTISGSPLTVCIGGTSTLTGSGTAAATNAWVSSNTAIATVSNPGSITPSSTLKPVTVSNVNSGGGFDRAWATAANLQQGGSGTSTTASMTFFGNTSQYLVGLYSATASGFQIPATATITGIQVSVTRVASGGNVFDNIISLVKANAQTGNNKNSGTAWPTTSGSTTYGANNDLWGATLTPADINSNTFGVAIQVVNSSAGTRTATVSSITMTVYYTLNTSSTATVTGVSAGTVTLTYTNNNGCVATTSFTVNPSTVITTQPSTPAAVCAGGTAPTLSVGATGTAITYQWFNNGTTNSNTGGTSVGSANGGQTANYTPSVSTAGTTYYYVTITGTCGTIKSNPVPVVVNALTAINTQPTAPAAACAGGTGTALTVSASGTSLTYQWFSNTVNSNSGGTSVGSGSGGQTASYTPPVASAGTTYYYVVVTGTCGVVTSNAVAVVVNPLPTISGVSGTTTICSGSTTTLTASSAAASPTYNWYAAASGGTALFTGAAFTTPALSSNTTYYVAVTNGVTGCVSSPRTSQVVTVNALPTVSGISGTTTVCSGGTTTLTASSAASTPTYNWYAAASGGSALFTGAAFTTPALVANTTYYVTVTDGTTGCTSSPRASQLVTVNTPPSISAQPVSTTTCAGTAKTFSVTAGGTSPTYQWQYSPDGTTWSNVVNGTPLNVTYSNATTATLTVTPTAATANGTYSYRVIVSVGSCASLNSNAATLQIFATPSTSVAGSNQTICATGTATLAANTPTVGTGTWSVTGPSTATSQFSNVNSPTAIFTPAGGAGTYTLTWTISNGGCTNSTSSLTLTVNAAPTAITITQTPSGSICANTIQTLAASGGVTSGTVLTQGFEGTFPPTGWTLLNNASSSQNWAALGAGTAHGGSGAAEYNTGNFSPNPASAYLISPGVSLIAGSTYTITYWWRTSNNTTYAEKLKLTVGNSATIAAQTTTVLDQATIKNSTYQQVTTTFTPGTSGTYYFAWVCYSPNNSTFGDYLDVDDISITGNTSAITWSPITNLYTDAGATTAYTSGAFATTVYTKPTGNITYTATSTGPNGCTATATATVTVNAATAITTQPQTTQTVCITGTPTNLTVAATGTGTLTYQWFSNATNSNTGGTSVGSANGGQTATYTPPTNVAGTVYYYVTVTGTCGSVSSSTAAVIVNPATAITTQPSAASVCIGGTAPSLTVTASGGSLTYQWFSNTVNSNSGGTSVGSGSGGQTASYTPSIATAGTTYYYVVVTGSCGSATSNAVAVTVNALPTISGISGTTTICSGGTTTLTASSAASSPTYNWYAAASGGSALFTGAAFTTPSLSSNTTYYVAVTNGVTGCVSSPRTSQVVTVNALPTISGISGTTTICSGGTTTLTASSAASSPTYNWYAASSGGSALASTAAFTTPTLSTNTTYYVAVTDGTTGCTSSPRTSQLVTVNTPATISTQPANTTTCAGTAKTFTVALSAGTSPTYQWQYSADGSTGWANVVNGTPANITYTNATTATLTVTPAAAAVGGTYFYRVIVSVGSCSSVTSNAASLAVSATPTTSVAGSNQTICSNATATLAANTPTVGTGTWSVTGQSSLASQFSNVNSPTAVFTPAGGAGTYTLTWTISNGSCTNSTSSLTLTVNLLPTITTQPSNGTTCAGTAKTFTVAASGTSPSYQWQYSADGSTGWANVVNGTPTGFTYSGGTTATLSATPPTASAGGTYFYRAIANVTGCAVSPATSNAASLTVNPNSTITLSSGAGTNNQSVCQSGSLTTPITFTVGGGGTGAGVTGLPTGLSGAFSAGTFTISGTVSASVTPGTFNYTVTTTGGGCTQATATGTITVGGTPTAMTISPSNPTICFGGNTLLTATGGGGVTYSILDSTVFEGDGSANRLLSNSAPVDRWLTNTSGTQTSGNNYWTISFNTGCEITGNHSLEIFRGTGSYCQYNNASTTNTWVYRSFSSTGYSNLQLTFNYKAGGEGGGAGAGNDYGTVTYSTDGTTWVDLPTHYSNQTTAASATVTFPSNILDNKATVYYGFRWTSNNNTGSGNGFIVDDVYMRGTNITGTNITWSPTTNLTPTTGASVTASPATTTTYTATSTVGGCTSSQTVTVNVNPQIPTVPAQTASICGSGALNFTPTGVTMPGGVTYTWSTPLYSNVSGTNTSGGTNQTAITDNLTNSGTSIGTATYTVVPSFNGTCAGSAFTLTVTVYPTIPNVGAQTGPSICTGASFSFTPSGVPSAATYTWGLPTYSSPSVSGGSTGSNASAITGTLTNSGTASGTATYTVTPSFNGNCQGTPFTVTVTVNPTVSATISYSGQPFCATGTANVTFSGTTGGQYTAPAGLAIDNTTGQINLDNSTAGTYTVTYTVAASGGCSQYQTTTSVHINPLPALESFTSSGNQFYCTPPVFGYDVQIVGSETGVTYQLLLNGSPVAGATMSGTGSSLDFGFQIPTGTYTVLGTNNTTGCNRIVTSQALILTVRQRPNDYNITVNGVSGVTTATVCAGSLGTNTNSLIIGLDQTDNGVVYGLYLNNSPVGSPQTGNGGPLSFPASTGAGTYKIYANSVCGAELMNGTVSVTSVALPGAPSLSVTQPTCAIATATITVTSPINGMKYSLDGGTPGTATTFTVAANTTHTVSAFNGTCYGAETTVSIDPQPVTPTAPMVSVTQPTCAVPSATITVTATIGYTYSIDNGVTFQSSNVFSGITVGGNYNVVVYNGSCNSSATQVSVTAPSTVPSAPTSLNLVGGPASISGTFTAPSPAPTNYLVIRTETATAPSVPVTGTTYTVGTNMLGGYIAAITTTPSFTDNTAVPGLTYWYWIYAYNAQTCVLYSATNLSGSAVANTCSGTSTLYWAGVGSSIPGANTNVSTYTQFNNAINWSTSAVNYVAATAPNTCNDLIMNLSTSTDQTIPLSAGTTVNSLTINSAGTAKNIVDAGSFTFTISNNVSISAGASANSKVYLTTEGGRLRIFGATTIGAPGDAGYSYIGNNDGTTTGGAITFRGNVTFNSNSAVVNSAMVGVTFDANGAETLTNNTNKADANVGPNAVIFRSVRVGNVNNTALTLAGTNGNYNYVNGGNLTVNPSSSLTIPAGYSLNQSTSGIGTLSLGAASVMNVGDGTNGASNAVAGSNFPGGFSTYTLDAASTVVYNSSNGVGQTVYAPVTYGNLILTNATGSGSSIKSLSSSITGIAGDLTVNSYATFDLGTFTANRTANGGTMTVAANSQLRIGGTAGGASANNNFPASFATYALDCSSTTEYYGPTQTIFATPTYGNLTVSSVGIKSAGGNLTICSNVLVNPSAIFDGVTFSHSVGGNWINNGTFTANTSTVAFTSSSSVQTIGGSTATTFGGLTIANTGGGVTLIDASHPNISKTVNGVLTLTNGMLTTDNTDLLIMADGSSSSLGAPDVTTNYYNGTSFVNGPMQKIGKTAFTFPVGKAGVGLGLVPIGIGDLQGVNPASQTFTAEYIHQSAYSLGPINKEGLPAIKNLSGCDYWRLDLGASGYPSNINSKLPTGTTVDLTLYWNPHNGAGCTGQYVTDPSTLAIAHLDFGGASTNPAYAGLWYAIGFGSYNYYSGVSTATSGKITYAGASTFSPFSLASSDGVNNPLPIKLEYFNAEKANGFNKLTWKADCTSSSASFDVERSSDGIHFDAIHHVDIATASDCSLPFNYDDYTSTGRKVYYRIRMTDIDGNVSYSEVRLILNDANTIELISIKPNPVESQAWLTISSSKNDKVELVILSIDGREIQRKSVLVQAGSSTILMETSALAKGMYIIRGVFSGGQTQAIPFLKQ